MLQKEVGWITMSLIGSKCAAAACAPGAPAKIGTDTVVSFKQYDYQT
jgi:hypothetical protein